MVQTEANPGTAPLSVRIPAGMVFLDGELFYPSGKEGLVVFAHGSGSSRHSPRNRYVALLLHKMGLGTLLFDLLTPGEEIKDGLTGALRFDIDLLGRRLVAATAWLKQNETTAPYKIGYFGASTGAAAALSAAAAFPLDTFAVVSRGGRPDLAAGVLAKVMAPTLLIVGGDDDVVIGLNQKAYDALRSEKELRIIPGATHLFEEPGALEQVADYAGKWFLVHLDKIR